MPAGMGRRFSAAMGDALTQALGKAWDQTASKMAERLAKQYKRELCKKIRQQLFRHKALTPEYAEWKRHHDLDKRILIATKAYVNAIEVRRKGTTGWVVGLPAKRHPGLPGRKSRSTITFEQLARVHEYGVPDRGLPARPHWRPMTKKYQQKQQQAATVLSRDFHRVAEAEIKRVLGLPP